MGTRFVSLLAIALAAVSVGCGNEEDAEPQPYGGEVRVVHLQLPDGGDIRFLWAYFIAEQEPDLAPADLAVGECGLDPSTIQGEGRQYIDVGETVTFHLGDGDFVAPRVEGLVDPLGRLHEVGYLLETYEPAGDDFFMAESSVTTAEPQSFSDRLKVLQPPRMVLDSPEPAGALSFPAGEDVEFAWHQTEPVDDLTVDFVFWGSGSAGDTSADVTVCRAADTGSFTVPADVIAGLGTDSGIVNVQSVSRATAVTEDGRAIDLRAQFDQTFPWAAE
jgi:hypothetical protein